MNAWQTAIAVAGALGMAALLYRIYNTKHGVPGFLEYDKDFKLPDMRFHYSPETLRACFEKLGAEGREKLLGYWRTDFAFIVCFWAVMFFLPLNVTATRWLIVGMQVAATLRALLDAVENALLMRCCRRFPDMADAMARVAAFVTSAKFLAMGAWLVALFGALLVRAFRLG